MLLTNIFLAVLPLLAVTQTSKTVQDAGNSTQRLGDCASYAIPPSFAQYLNTSFLGERKSIEVGPVNYSYYQFGPLYAGATGRPLIMVSGQGATLGIWTPDLLKTLATGRQVTIFDNRGIGYSNDADPEEENTVLGYADSTVDLIDALGLEQPDILGWSLGGFITLTLVTSFPDAVNRVVLADTSAGGQGTSATSLANLNAISTVLLSGQSLPPTYIYPDTDAGNAGLCRLVASQMVMPNDPLTPAQVGLQTPAIEAYLEGPDTPAYTGLHNLTNPLLVIAGTQDQILSLQDDKTIVSMVSGACLLQYADSGHAAILQHGATNGAVISAFLDA